LCRIEAKNKRQAEGKTKTNQGTLSFFHTVGLFVSARFSCRQHLLCRFFENNRRQDKRGAACPRCVDFFPNILTFVAGDSGPTKQRRFFKQQPPSPSPPSPNSASSSITAAVARPSQVQDNIQSNEIRPRPARYVQFVSFFKPSSLLCCCRYSNVARASSSALAAVVDDSTRTSSSSAAKKSRYRQRANDK